MRIGLDFGTTNTSAAVFDGSGISFIPLDVANHNPSILRSLIYVTKNQERVLGITAAKRYLRENTGRPAKYVWMHVGTIENTFARTSVATTTFDAGPLTMIREVYVQVDVAAPGRLLQSVKTGLRDSSYIGTQIFDRFYSVQELVALILEDVRFKAEAFLGHEVREVVLGRPVKFSGDIQEDQFAERKLLEAAHLAGYNQVQFEYEPIAAALFYTKQIDSRSTVLVFDFGGGTLDLTVMEVGGGIPERVIATEGVLVGGDDLDGAIMKGRLVQYFGTRDRVDAQGQPFPSHMASKLEQWQTIPDLSKDDTLKIIKRARVSGSNPRAFAALESLVINNYGFELFQHIERTKRRLSDRLSSQLTMRARDIEIAENIRRDEFEVYIAEEVRKAAAGLDEVLLRAGLTESRIDAVVTTGGSSLIPVFKNMLRSRFHTSARTSLTKFVRSDTFGSVTAGLSIRASELD